MTSQLLHLRPFAVVTSLLVGGCLLSGCAGPGSTAVPTDAPSPLDAYFSLLGGQQSDEQMQKENAAIQDAIAACMNEQGFEYVPDTEGGSFSVNTSDLDWESEEFAKTYGYGITTDPFGAQQEGDEVSPVDPNADYIASLSASEQNAYNEALWGRPVESPSSDAEPIDYDWKTAGCTGSAQHEVSGEEGGDYWEDPEFTALNDDMNALYSAVRETPVVVQKEGEWASCMAEAGFGGFSHKDQPANEVSEQYGALTAPTGTDATSTPPDADAGSGTFVVPDGDSDIDPVKLEQLQEHEIALATADFTCAHDTGYTSALESEQNRLEQQFVDEHKATLDALVARYGAE